jgi:hypothetical protein
MWYIQSYASIILSFRFQIRKIHFKYFRIYDTRFQIRQIHLKYFRIYDTAIIKIPYLVKQEVARSWNLFHITWSEWKDAFGRMQRFWDPRGLGEAVGRIAYPK